jgi:hypothetical protein
MEAGEPRKQENQVNSYIVRIYRSTSENQSGPVGIVEDVERRERNAFRSIEELWQILVAPKDRSPPKSRAGLRRSKNPACPSTPAGNATR